ncbi:hypothetical protein V6Z12_D08G208800 [Gossypium hirsutum]
MILFYLMVIIISSFMKSQLLSNSNQVIHHQDKRLMATFTFHQPCNTNENISFAHISGYEFQCCE